MYINIGLDLTEEPILIFFLILYLGLKSDFLPILFDLLANEFFSNVTVDLLDILHFQMTTSSMKL